MKPLRARELMWEYNQEYSFDTADGFFTADLPNTPIVVV